MAKRKPRKPSKVRQSKKDARELRKFFTIVGASVVLLGLLLFFVQN